MWSNSLHKLYFCTRTITFCLYSRGQSSEVHKTLEQCIAHVHIIRLRKWILISIKHELRISSLHKIYKKNLYIVKSKPKLLKDRCQNTTYLTLCEYKRCSLHKLNILCGQTNTHPTNRVIPKYQTWFAGKH